MTDRQRHILRILADPVSDPPGLHRLHDADREAIQAALDEVERLRSAVEAALLFHSGTPWTPAKSVEWWNLTQSLDVTSKALCDTLRAAVAGEVLPARRAAGGRG